VQPIIFLLALFALTSTAAAQSTVYKWVDADGKVQYSQTPPQDVSHEKVHLPVSEPATGGSSTLERLQKQLDQIDQERAEQAQQQQQAREARNQEELRSRNCKQARANLQALQSNADVIQTRSDGSKFILTAEQREQRLKQTNKDIEYYCN